MRNYELTYIVASDVDEQEYNGIVAQVQKWIEESSGSVTNFEAWGRRKLAYAIGSYTEGFYVSLRMDLPPQSLMELERNLGLSEKVIRHLVVRTDEQ